MSLCPTPQISMFVDMATSLLSEWQLISGTDNISACDPRVTNQSVGGLWTGGRVEKMRKKPDEPEECWSSICNNERMRVQGQTEMTTMLDASNSPIKSLKLLQHVSGHTGINVCYLQFFFPIQCASISQHFPEVHNIHLTQGITFGYVIIKARFKKIEHTSMLLLHTVRVQVKTYRRSSWSALNLHLRQIKPKIFHLETDDCGAAEARRDRKWRLCAWHLCFSVSGA